MAMNACVCVCVFTDEPFLSCCISSGRESKRRAPTLISFSTLCAVMSNGLGSFSHTIAAVCAQELSKKWNASTMNFSVPKSFPSRFSGYIELPGKQVTTGCRWQKEGLWGRSGAGLGPSPSHPETPSLSPPFPCLWFKKKRKKKKHKRHLNTSTPFLTFFTREKSV